MSRYCTNDVVISINDDNDFIRRSHYALPCW
jgi:hypothetical protein